MSEIDVDDNNCWDNDESEEEPKYKLPEEGPKKYGIKPKPEEEALEAINKELIDDPDYGEVENLQDQLKSFKAKFLEFDRDADGNIDLMGLSRMMEKLGQAKTHLEMKKMIKEIDRTNKGTICYRDFVNMMIGPKTSVLKLILMFEEKKKEKERPKDHFMKYNMSPEDAALEAINQEFLHNTDYAGIRDLKEQLQLFKVRFLEFDKDRDGRLDLMGLAGMLEKFGQAKTYLETKQLFNEIDRARMGSISYKDFIRRMIVKTPGSTSVRKLATMFEASKKTRNSGVAPKKDLSSLP